MKIEHCCVTMDENIRDSRVQLFYDKIQRKYYVNVMSRDGSMVGAHQCFIFCPFCGKTLPKSLTEEYIEILENEYGLNNHDIDDGIAILPEEFKSDEWWRKRGL